METGIILRGKLLGVRPTVRKYTNANGEEKTTNFTEIGIETYGSDGYGGVRPFVNNVRISAEKEKDSAFMKSLNDNHFAIVELPVQLGNFQSIYTDRNAVLSVLEQSKVA
ncbi:DNA-binding protein [Colwellia sp. RE-S-Sl-9]